MDVVHEPILNRVANLLTGRLTSTQAVHRPPWELARLLPVVADRSGLCRDQHSRRSRPVAYRVEGQGGPSARVRTVSCGWFGVVHVSVEARCAWASGRRR